MKKTCWTIGLFAIISFFAGSAMGTDASIDLGKKLFNDPTLGGSSNDKSCGSCHRSGEGLEKAGAQTNLPKMINFCIERPLKGKKLEDGSVELESLKMYIKSVSK